MGGKLADREMLFEMAVEKVLMTDSAELNGIFGAEEGLGNILKREVRKYQTYNDIVKSLKSKRYTETRVLRTLLMIMLDITKADVLCAKNYIRVLAFDEKGASYLKQVKKAKISNLPIITNINKDLETFEDIKPTLQKDILANDLYNLATGRNLYENSDYVKMPYRDF